jgi:hypothetical protein
VLDHFHVTASADSGHVALQGQLGRLTVIVRVNANAIDDLDESGGEPTVEHRTAFARHNIEAIRAIAQGKIDHGDAESESWFGREVLSVRIRGADFAEYLSHPGNRLNYAAFDPRVQSMWIGRDGRF